MDRAASEGLEETLDRLLHGLVFGQHGDDGVHAARDEVLGLRDLGLGVALAVGLDQLDAVAHEVFDDSTISPRAA